MLPSRRSLASPTLGTYPSATDGPKTPLSMTIASAVSACAIGVRFFLARVLSVNYWTREQFAILWRNHHLPFYYQQLHVIQVATYSPWIVVIVLCFGALLLSWRLKLAGRSDQRNT